MFKERLNFEEFVPKNRLVEGSLGQVELIPIDVSKKEEYNFVYRSIAKIFDFKKKETI